MTSNDHASTCRCGCCAGVEPSTPARLENRAGLGEIAYRIGDHARFRESLVAGLSSSAHPALARLRTRDEADFTIALLDAFACAADVLTFYQERLANESYLRTATERLSLQQMAALLGYRLRPGVAAESWLAFALEPPKTPPPSLPPDPGAFVTGIPASLVLEPGLRVQSIPGPGELPQTFETVERIEVRAAWNAIRPVMHRTVPLRAGATSTWLQGVDHHLKAGDLLVFAGEEFLRAPASNNNWDVRLIDRVELDTTHDRTFVHWARGLGSIVPPSRPSASPEIFVLRRRTAVFGHNAPRWSSMNREFREDYPADPDAPAEWPSFTIGPGTPSDEGGRVDLDAVYSEVAPGSLAVLTTGELGGAVDRGRAGTYAELYRVSSAAEVSRAEFAISGKVTRLGLQGQNLAEKFHTHVRQTSVYVQSERLVPAAHPIAEDIGGDHLPLAVSPDGLDPGRRLIVTGHRVADGASLSAQVTIVRVETGADGTVAVITPPLPAPLRRVSLVVHANVALATHGETAAQILGSADAGRVFQRFELTRGPLTHRAAANETGAEAALSVRVGDVEWTGHRSLSGAGASDRVYALETDEQGRTFVVFGDGHRGARPTSGVNNVRARYRVGLGQAGNVAAGALTQLLTRPLGLKGVANPLPASGGTDPEPADEARRSIPLGTRTLGRVVSVLDYEDFALAFSGVARAQARMLPLASGSTVVITIGGPHGTVLLPDNPVFTNLLAALKASGDPHVPVLLLPHVAATFRVALRVKCDPAYDAAVVLAAVESALRAHYGADARGLAEPVRQSDLVATVHGVAGVVAVDLDRLYGGTSPVTQTRPSLQTRLLAAATSVRGGRARAAEWLTLDPTPLDRLEEMP